MTEQVISDTALNISSQHDEVAEESADDQLKSGDIYQIGLIDPVSEICSSCHDADAKNCAIICYVCENYYHATCRNANGDRKGKDIICRRSFYNSYSSMIQSSIYSKRSGSFIYTCESCKISLDNLKVPKLNLNSSYEVTQNDMLNSKSFQDLLLDAVTDKLSSFKNDILSQVKNTVAELIDSTQVPQSRKSTNVFNVDNNGHNSTQCSIPTYASVAANNQPQNSGCSPVYLSNNTVIDTPSEANEDVIILSNIDGKTCAPVEAVKRKVSEKFKKIPFDFANDRSKSKKIAIRFKNTKAAEDGIKAISSSEFLTELGYKYDDATKMLPKITLSGIPRFVVNGSNHNDLTEDQRREEEKKLIVSEILDKNHCINELVSQGHTLQVVYLSKFNNGELNNVTVGLKVSPLIRTTVLSEQSGYVFIGGRKLLFKDRFHVKQCYHCQHLGHISTDCPEKSNEPTCLYCMGSHRSSSCKIKHQIEKHCCAKCHTSKNTDDVASYGSHNSASLDCPVLVRECKRLAMITDFTSKNLR